MASKETLHFWSVFKGLVNLSLLLSLIEELPDFRLEVADSLAVQIAVQLREIRNGVGHSAISEELIVDEFEQCDVELGKSSHHFVIDIERQPLVKFVRSYPGDLLSQNFDAVVDTLDRVECFGEALAHCAVEHEVTIELAACFELALFDFEGQVLGELREQGNQTKSIIEVTERVDKSRVPFFDDGSKRVLGRLSDVVFSELCLSATQQFLMLLQVCFDLSEL